MPIPTPHADESQADYLERGHKALYKDYPDTDQRNAILFKTWREHHGESEEEKKAHSRFTGDEYQHLQDIPVFKEHSYVRILRRPDGQAATDDDGNPRQIVEHYDLKALKAIVDNCNKRVRETGSFAPVTAIHTGKRKPNGEFINPEVLGFAGPYRLGMYGNEDRTELGLSTKDGIKKGLWAIYNDEFWFKDKAHRARELARRSPEVYVGRPMHDRFLDPITALGAETPALDMGVHYHLSDKGELIERYSSPNITVKYAAAAMPGPANVSVPGEVKVEQHGNKAQYDVDQYEEESPSDVSDVDSKSLMHHHKESFNFHKKAMQHYLEAGNKPLAKLHENSAIQHKEAYHGLKNAGESPIHPALEQDFRDTLRGLGHSKPEIESKVTAARSAGKKFGNLQEMIEHAYQRPKQVEASAVKYQLEQELTDVIAQYAADPDTVNACVNAMMNTQIIKRIESYLDSQDAPVNQKEQEEMEAAQEIESELEEQPNESEVEGAEQTGQPPEAGQPPAAPEGTETPGESGNPPEEKGTEMAEAPKPAAPPEAKKPEEKERYEMQEFMRDMKIKYDQQETRIAQLESNNTQLVTERNQAVRERKIIDLRRKGFVFDENEAVSRYSQASEEVFQTWADTIVASAERVPLNSPNLYVPSLDVPQGAQEQVGQYGGVQLNEAEEIAQYALRKSQETGEHVSWEDAKAKVMEKREKRARKQQSA